MSGSEKTITRAPEFSRLVIAETIPGGEMIREIEANASERQALAARFDLVVIDRLTATIRLRRVDGGRLVRVRGVLDAAVVQSCVVTLDPVPATVNESFSAIFTSEASEASEEGEIILDPDAFDEDLPEPMVDGAIDIGELTAQHLSLALDPYPRRPGAEFPGLDDDGVGEPSATITPFQALAAFKRGS